jgi:hypothetical protein
MKTYVSEASKEKAAAAWVVAQRLQQFGYKEIGSEMTISIAHATHIVRGWEAEGKIRLIDETSRKIYELVPAHEIRILPVPGDGFEQMWTAMRKLARFSPTDLSAHCATPVTVKEAASYCRLLMDAGYLRVISKAVPNRKEAIYRLFTQTGVKAPRERRIRCIVDPNTGVIKPLVEVSP